MDIEKLKENLNQYFNYIKVVFIREYSKYMSEEKTKEINDMNNIFRIDCESKFKIYESDKINICLNIKDFIEDNKLQNDSDLKDISISGKVYVKFLIDNKDDIERLILNIILKPIIIHFIGKKDDVIHNGTIDLIVQNFIKKYNIKYIAPYESKELEIVNLLKSVVNENIIYSSVLNNKIEVLSSTYDLTFNEYFGTFLDLREKLNNEYQIYSKRIGKVYYSDTLYDYQNINYNKEKSMLNEIIKTKFQSDNTKKNRFFSAKKCIENLKNHLILFNQEEQNLLNNSSLEIDIMLSQVDGNEESIDENYTKLIKFENKVLPLTDKIWIKQLTHPVSFVEGQTFCFLTGVEESKKITEARLITDKHLKNVNNKLKFNYGFIYKMENNKIIYASSKDILAKEIDETVNNENVINFNDIRIEIDNQSDSKLITPEILMRETIKNKESGKVLLYSPTIIGVFVIYDSEFNGEYKKALELSEKLELPLIKINRNYYRTKDESIVKIEKNNNITLRQNKVKKFRIKEKFKTFKNQFFYEENVEEISRKIG